MAWTARLAVAVAVLALSAPASAATIDVNTGSDVVADDGVCSLREAVIAANTDTASGAMVGECAAGNGPDVINLPGNAYPLTHTGALENASATGDLDITEDVTISGSDSGTTTINGNATDRVLQVITGDVTINDVTITNGLVPISGTPGTAGGDGGAILNSGVGKLAVNNSIVSNNSAGAGAPGAPSGANGGPAGAGGAGGGIYSNGDLQLAGTTVSGNHAGNGGIGGQGGFGGFNFGGAGGNGGSGGGVFVAAGKSLTLVGSTLDSNHAGNGGTGGGGDFAGGAGAAGAGGGIAAAGDTQLSNSAVTNNGSGAGAAGAFGITISGGGSSGGNGGGIRQIGGTLGLVAGTVIRANATGNGGSTFGGAVGSGSGGAGGGVFASGSAVVTVQGSAIDANKTGDGGSAGSIGGGGGAGGGVAIGTATMTLENSYVSNNTTGQGGTGAPGGPGGDGAGIHDAGTATLRNVTLSGNATGASAMPGNASRGGGIYHASGAVTNLTHVTIAGNSVPTGGTGAGGIHAVDNGVTLTNSIVASNGVNCVANAGSIADGGHNLSFGDASCPGTNGDPKLGALADNGGGTKTMALGVGSAAIDIVPANGAGCLATDQRGTARPLGSACDAGAFELAPPLPTPPAGDGGSNTPPADTTPTPTPAATDKTPPVVKLLLTKQKLAKALKKGYACTFSTNELGTASVKLGKLGSGRLTVKKTGRQSLVCKFTTKAKKALAKKKKVTFKLTLVVKDAAGNATTKTAKVTLRR